MKDDIKELESKFISLKKKDVAIEQYSTKFLEYISFVTRRMSDESSKISQFIEGLPWEYQVQVNNATIYMRLFV